MSPLRRLLGLLPTSQRLALIPVFAVALLAAVFETAGVVSILPFMAIVMDPSALQRYGPLREALATVDLVTPQEILLTVGLLSVSTLAAGNAVGAASLWIQARYVARARQLLSAELFDGYLRQPYSFHIQRDAASLTKVAFSDVELALGGYLAALLTAFTRTLAALLILTILLLSDPQVAVGAGILLGGGYISVYRLIRVRQHNLGDQVSVANEVRARSALEALGGVKELRVLGREATAIDEFSVATQRLVRAQVGSTLISSLPRYIIEVMVFGGIVVITLLMVIQGDAAMAVPTMALYAFAGYRLMPAFQQIYSAATHLKYYSPSVAVLESDLAVVRASDSLAPKQDCLALPLTRDITFRDVSFFYPGAVRPALQDVSLVIRRNESIGLVGKTGSGKTTLIDLLLGLYHPDRGSIFIDGIPLTEQNERAWRRRVGYVPQQVFLANASVSQNIALGLPSGEIDLERVYRAARMAQAHEFIAQLPSSYHTLVGERGVRLSGGQRQRLGIARALYHDPDVLIFDEATSALDGMTEDAVMHAIRGLSRDRTVILIAHRLRTVEACDRIVMLEAGSVVATGSHDDLMRTSIPYRRLAGANAVA